MGFLSSRSSSDVQPCEVILGGMLSPAATIRDSKRTHFASLSYRLPRTLGIMSLCFHGQAFCVIPNESICMCTAYYRVIVPLFHPLLTFSLTSYIC